MSVIGETLDASLCSMNLMVPTCSVEQSAHGTDVHGPLMSSAGGVQTSICVVWCVVFFFFCKFLGVSLCQCQVFATVGLYSQLICRTDASL